jgi:HAD superfamily hydrolase (TIGR01509 family)
LTRPDAGPGAVRYVFLDNGGVITDNSLLGPEYERLVGAFLAPRLGGTVKGWGEANRLTIGVRERSVARLEAWDDATDDILREYYIYNLDWLTSMCEALAIDPPAADIAAELGAEANQWILSQAPQAFPGALDAIRQLARERTLFTASEGPSFQLATILGHYGIAGLFARLYGPDLVNTAKQAPAYYERIFADAGVEPPEVLVVDDSTEMLTKAARAGASTILVSKDARAQSPFDGVIEGLSALPAVLSDSAWRSK